MAMEALTVVVRVVEPDLRGRRDRPEVLHVKVPQAAQLRVDATKHRVIGVARVAGTIAWDTVILEMRRRQIAGIVNEERPAKVSHHVAGEAEPRALGPLHLRRIAGGERQTGQQEEGAKRED